MSDSDIHPDLGARSPDAASRRLRDPEAARRRILQAAEREFAARGPAGARVDRIARASGLNKRMLYHYFGGKQVLYRTVLERSWPARGERWRPEAARLLLWALLDPASAADALAALRRRGTDLPVAAGAIDPDADPAAMVVESLVAGSGTAAQQRSETSPDMTAGAASRRKPRIRLKHRRE